LKEGGKEGGREGSEEKERYRPAHELVDWTLERANRIVAEEGEGEGEGGKKKETKTDMEAGGNRRSVPTTPPTTMATTTVAGDEGTGSGRWNENVSSSSLPRHVSSGSLPRHVSRGNMANEDGEGEGAGRLQGRLQQQQQQQVSLPPPRHMRRLSSFAERLPVALLCVGDFLSVRVRNVSFPLSIPPSSPLSSHFSFHRGLAYRLFYQSSAPHPFLPALSFLH